MNGKRKFTNELTPGQAVAAVGYLPIHLWLLPMLVTGLFAAGRLGSAGVNLLCYGAGCVYMLAFLGRFLARDFAIFQRDPARVFGEAVMGYGLMILCNFIVNILLMFLAPPGANPNNNAVFAMAEEKLGSVAVLAVLLAPLVEECIFRAGIFGTIRRFSRVLAYAVTMLLFSAYHVWSFALSDPKAWIYMLQYFPATFLLCRCYERTGTIWGSISLHMLINGISILIMSLLNKAAELQRVVEALGHAALRLIQAF